MKKYLLALAGAAVGFIAGVIAAPDIYHLLNVADEKYTEDDDAIEVPQEPDLDETIDPEEYEEFF